MTGDSASTVNRNSSLIYGKEIECAPLQDFIRLLNLSPPYFIKIDTEGFETQILPSLSSWIYDFKPILYISMHRHVYNFTDEDIVNVLGVLNSFPFIYEPTIRAECYHHMSMICVESNKYVRFVQITSTLTHNNLCINCDYICSFKELNIDLYHNEIKEN